MAHHSHGETQTSLANLLLDYLMELSDEELKGFKWRLSHTKYKELKPLPRDRVRHLDRTDLADKMISSYSEVDALNVMLDILKKMNLNDLAHRLNEDLQEGPQAGSELGDILEQNTIMSERPKPSGAWRRKRRREEEWEKDREELMSSMIKYNLKQKCERVFEGQPKGGQPKILSEIYTELYITEGGTGGVNDEHEVRKIETASKKRQTEDTAVKCSDIFKPLCGHKTPIRTVLTKGVAGIGKTVSVQKFILDWAEGKANQDVHFIFALPFRNLNLIKDKYSLNELLHRFVPELKSFQSTELFRYKILFIFDGLDECRLPLDFQSNKSWFDVTKKTSLDVLLTNLIKGNLLPSALLWLTSRPAAANQIPSEYIHRVTEIRGFSDAQKEEYFRRRFRDQSLASRIITHVKSSRSLFIMCHIPVFCWISATVLERLFSETDGGEIPRTLTEIYTHFLIFQTSLKNEKYMKKHETKLNKSCKSDREFLLKLGKLAFDNLEKGNLIFYEQDLTENDIDVAEASVYSGVCTEVFKEEYGLYQEKVYCFVHLSIQEYLAALYVFLSNSSADLLETAVDQALESKNGHLDLYLRFLLGLSADSSKRLLQSLLSSHNIRKTAKYITEKIQENLSPERTINLFHCLTELGDNSLVEEVQRYLNSGSLSAEDLSPAQYSALAFVMLMSDEELDVFDLKKYIRSDEEHWRLLPVVKNSRTALMNSCDLTEKCCEPLASALRSNSSSLRELDLSDNDLQDSGVKLLSAGLGDSHCKLGILRLTGCRVTEEGCSSLASALRSNPSHLRELDLSYNHPGASGVKLLFAVLEDPSCKLEKLKVDQCELTEKCCEALVSALRSNSSPLRELDLSDNDLQDSGVKLLSAGLGDSHSKLEILRLSGCRFTEEGCSSLASALRSNPSHLRELDLSYNHPGASGVKLLFAVLEDPSCKLEKLNVDHSGECRTRPGLQKYSCQLTLDPNTANRLLSLSGGNRKVTGGEEEQPYPDHPERFDGWCPQVLCRESLTGRCYWEAEWDGNGARIGVTYKGIGRKGGSDCRLGANDKSWSLYCDPVSYSVLHNNKLTLIPIRPSGSRRVGVYLDWGAGALSFYRVSSDGLTLLHRFTSSFTEPLYPGFWVPLKSSVLLALLAESSNMQDTTKFMESEKPSSLQHCRASTSVTVAWDWFQELVSGNEKLFTPDVVETSNMREYRFQAKHPGRFFCRVTGLVFVMKFRGEVTYSFCSWEKAPRTPGSWSPAGPHINIECPQGTLKELHLPRCEMSAGENLAVAHVTKDNMEILRPQEVTDTHVVISVTGLSLFEILMRKIFPMVRGQVLLLLRPVQKILNVFLLPLNVPPDQVHQQKQQRQNIVIPTSSMCKLVHNARYRISSDHKAIRRIQPENEEFGCRFDEPIYPTFEVFLNRDEEEVELSVLEDRSGEIVWRRFIDLTGAVPPSPSTTDTGVAFVDQHREAIIQRVSLIDPILDDLHEQIGEEKYNNIRAGSTSQEKMRRLYDVLNTDKLKELFLEALNRKEPHLVSDLGNS